MSTPQGGRPLEPPAPSGLALHLHRTSAQGRLLDRLDRHHVGQPFLAWRLRVGAVQHAACEVVHLSREVVDWVERQLFLLPRPTDHESLPAVRERPVLSAPAVAMKVRRDGLENGG